MFKENDILKNNNQSELNAKIIHLDKKFIDLQSEKELLKAKLKQKDDKIQDLQKEMQIFRNQAE
jgi:predicted nuclease with TOPRIM domain